MDRPLLADTSTVSRSHSETRLEIDQDLSVASNTLPYVAGHNGPSDFCTPFCHDGVDSNLLDPNDWTSDTVLFSVFRTQRSTHQYLESDHLAPAPAA